MGNNDYALFFQYPKASTGAFKYRFEYFGTKNKWTKEKFNHDYKDYFCYILE